MRPKSRLGEKKANFSPSIVSFDETFEPTRTDVVGQATYWDTQMELRLDKEMVEG
jgi:hypothetical protein